MWRAGRLFLKLMTFMKNFLWAVAAVIFVGGAGFWAGRCSRAKMPAGGVRVDTFVVRDTIRDTVLQAVSRRVVRVDTVWLPGLGFAETHQSAADGEPILQADSIAVAVPIERKVHQTDDYRAEIEGFRASLVSMEIYRQTQIITRTVATKRLSLGLQAGYGITPRGPQPYLGVGVNYSIWSW